MEQLGNRIRELRERRKLSQRDLAVLVGEHQTKISFIERNERGMSLEFAIKLANALGVSVEELTTTSDEPAKVEAVA